MKLSTKSKFFVTLAILTAICAAFLWKSFLPNHAPNNPLLLNDVSRLNQTRVSEIHRVKSEEELINAVRRARELGMKVSISGKKHSQGGHAFYTASLHLDMTQLNQVLSLDEKEKTIRVQSGATWKQIQDHINPYGLAVKVMQSSNIFTIGGSLSANAHGRDPRFGPIIETVRSFRLLKPDGSIVKVSRTENEELFRLAIGGFGLFGVILDVELELTENKIYEKRTTLMDYKDYPEHFQRDIKDKSDVGLHFGRLSIDPDSLLRDAYAVTYTETDETPDGIHDLIDEQNIRRDKFFFGLSRRWNWAKGFRWRSQKDWIDNPDQTKIVARNNAMRPPVAFLTYDSEDATDILQEYFIPVGQFVHFIDELREIVKDNEINLLSVTIRYVPKNEEAFLSYTRSDSFAVVLYINHGLSKQAIDNARQWTQQLVDTAHAHDGTYFLIYQLYPTQQQIRTAYPQFDQFLQRKQSFDENELFMNKFYEHYANPAPD